MGGRGLTRAFKGPIMPHPNSDTINAATTMQSKRTRRPSSIKKGFQSEMPERTPRKRATTASPRKNPAMERQMAVRIDQTQPRQLPGRRVKEGPEQIYQTSTIHSMH